MTAGKLNLLIFILLHHQEERTLDISRTLRWHYPPLAGRRHVLGAVLWNAMARREESGSRGHSLFTLWPLGKVSLFSWPRCMWIRKKYKSWSSAPWHPTEYSLSGDSAFRFILVSDLIQTKLERRECVPYPEVSLRSLRWDFWFVKQFFIKSFSNGFLYLEWMELIYS